MVSLPSCGKDEKHEADSAGERRDEADDGALKLRGGPTGYDKGREEKEKESKI
jgi:hypothetical protein